MSGLSSNSARFLAAAETAIYGWLLKLAAAGTLFYTGGNDALDANDFFLNRAGSKKNALRRHQFGGTAGGPIVRDKTFWFFSYEAFRDKTQQPLNARVPTAAERATVTDPVSHKVLAFFPDANRPLIGSTLSYTPL